MTTEPAGVPAPSVVIVGRGFEAWGRLPLIGGQRVSDHFNERRTMLILESAQLEGCPTFDSAADELAINRNDILLVVPVAEAKASATATHVVHKEQHRVRLLVGDWVVEGDIHVTPEQSVERFINMGHGEFMPLTHARLTGPDTERIEELVLIHRRHIRLLRPVSVLTGEALADVAGGS
ncbi:MAG: hypothetical protein NVSMB29_06050 [Candidatus Dormibacteria bacterium]